MTSNRAWAIVAILLAVIVLLWLLKVAVKLLFIGVIVVAAIAAWQVAKERIGGPRDR